MTPRTLLAACLLWSAASCAHATDRDAELQKLLADFDAAQAAYDAQQSEFPADATDADRIERYKSYPRWIYLPKILALAEADPADNAALEASQWIINQARHVGNQWGPLFEAETTAWRIVAGQQLAAEEISQLCLIAARRRSPAREAFLRNMASRTDLAGNAQAFAVAALAEYLAQRADEAEAGGFATWWPDPEDEYFEFLRSQLAEPWVEYASVVDPAPYRQESIELFRRVADQYGDVPINFETPYFLPDVKTLGQQARRSLHILERLVAGAPAPDAEGRDLDGNPLRLSDYRGKVVVLSFWFPTCGPCIAAIPEEQDVVDKFRDKPFALIGVCRESDPAVAKQTAKEHGMTWPSWFDGQPGAITGDYNVMSWPTFYLLDAEGRIVSKNVPPGKLAEAVEAVLHPTTSETGRAVSDRAAELEELLADYEAARAEFLERELPENPTPAERIAQYKSNFLWPFLAKFLALAEADPTDDVAIRACKWLVEGHGQYVSWQPVYDADQAAWRLLQRQRLTEDDIRQLCSTAAWRQSPASEAFLRDMASRDDLPGNAQAYATAALAEFLAARVDGIEAGGLKATWPPPNQPKEYVEFLETQFSEPWLQFDSAADPAPIREESIALFRRVRDSYANVPLTGAARHATLGEKAEHHLYVLEHLVIGAPAPDVEGVDLDGNPLRLSDYRGKVVMLSFWFTGCQPCIAALPEEKKLVEKFRDEPFALLGIATDDDIAVSKKTAAEHGMTWPSWFDKYPGTIVEKFNISGHPRFYLLDAEGRIVSKNVPRGKLAEAVEAVLHSREVAAKQDVP